MVSTPKIELERMELTSQLEETLGTDTARTLMAHIPPINTEQLATKDDLRMFATKDGLNLLGNEIEMVRNEIEMLKNEIDMVRNEIEMLKNEIDMVRKDLGKDIEMVEIRLNAKIGQTNAKMDAGFKDIRSEIAFGFSEQNNRLAQQTKQFIVTALILVLPVWIALTQLLI